MSETLATYANQPTPKLAELYRRWAASGIGLLITGNVMIDRRALGEPGNVVIEDEADLPALRQWASAATDQGAAIWVQLNHPGKQATKGLNAGTIAPSAVPFREDIDQPDRFFHIASSAHDPGFRLRGARACAVIPAQVAGRVSWNSGIGGEKRGAYAANP